MCFRPFWAILIFSPQTPPHGLWSHVLSWGGEGDIPGLWANVISLGRVVSLHNIQGYPPSPHPTPGKGYTEDGTTLAFYMENFVIVWAFRGEGPVDVQLEN